MLALGTPTTARAWRDVTLTVKGGGVASCFGLRSTTPHTSPVVTVAGLDVSLSSCVSGRAVDVPPLWRVRGADVVVTDGALAASSVEGVSVAGELASARVALKLTSATSSTGVGILCAVGASTRIADTRVVVDGSAATTSSIDGVRTNAGAACVLSNTAVSIASATSARGIVVAGTASAVLVSVDVMVDASASATGIDSDGSVNARQTAVKGTSALLGAGLDVGAGLLRCDHCVVEGFTSAVASLGSVFIGASLVAGPVTGTVTCVSSYDAAYDPLTCP
jgi:hypothetical protein